MRPLIDADILLYEVGFGSQKTAGGEIYPRSWDFCQDLLEKKLALICSEVGATHPPTLYLTNSVYINSLLNKQRKRREENQVVFLDVFRNSVAKDREYKGHRKSREKPFHYKGLINHILATYDVQINETGLEADDLICIEQTKQIKSGVPTIICSRDKDLKQCPGFHYTWECNNQPSYGPVLIEKAGFLEKNSKNNVIGGGDKFFYYQMLTGDNSDNIIGCMGRGKAFAYNLLKDATSERECYELVAEVYVKDFGDEWVAKWEEMSSLLWIIKELDENGEPVLWSKPPLTTTII